MKPSFLRMFALALLGTSVFSASAFCEKQAPPKGAQPKPFILPKQDNFTLPNGMKVTLVPYGQVPKVAVAVIVDAGAIDESADQVWIAELTTEMMKEGTQKRSAAEVDEAAAKMGGSVDVNVGPDQTDIGGDVLSEFGPDFVKLLAEVIQQPKLPETELSRLKNDLLRKLTISKTQPQSIALEHFRKILYPHHPYGRVFPTEAMLQGYDLAAVKKFYSGNFGAARTHVYVTGQFNAPAVKKAITESFSGWSRGTPANHDVPDAQGKRVVELVDRPGAAQSTVYLGLPVADPSNSDFMPLRVANALLGGSFGSRITANIREQKGYTYSPNSQVSVRYRDAYWLQVADVTTAVTGPSLKEIFFEIDRLQKTPPSEAELDGIKNYLAGVFVLQNSSRQGVLTQLAFRDLHGLGDQYLETYVQKIHAVTPKQVQEITAKYIRPEKMAIVVIGDKAKIADQVAPYEQTAGAAATN